MKNMIKNFKISTILIKFVLSITLSIFKYKYIKISPI